MLVFSTVMKATKWTLDKIVKAGVYEQIKGR